MEAWFWLSTLAEACRFSAYLAAGTCSIYGRQQFPLRTDAIFDIALDQMVSTQDREIITLLT
jgi:hypothetical protein